MAVIDELIAILGYDLRGEGDLARFNSGLDRTQRHAEAVANRMNTLGVAVGTFIGNIAYQFATRIGSAIGSLPGDILDVGKQFEGYQIRLETLLGSQEKANQALAWIQNFAKSTPLEIADVTDAYADLVNYGLDPTNGTLQAITDAMAGSGKGTETLKRLTLALGQAWVKQKLQGQEILQLTEAGIPVWDMLSKATGKNVAELQKLSEKGKLGRKEIQLLIDAIGKKYVGASEKFAKTLTGITSNLSDNWTQFLKRIADAGFYADVKDRLAGLLDLVNQWAADGTLDRWAHRISAVLSAVLDTVAAIVDRLATHIAFIAHAFDGISTAKLDALGIALGLLFARVFPAAWAIGVLALAVDDFLTYLEGGKSKIGDFIKWIQDLTGASEGLAKVLAAIIGSLGLLIAMRPIATLGALGKLFGIGAGGAAAAGTGAAAAEAAGGAAAGGSGILAWLLPKLSVLGSMLLLSGDKPQDEQYQPTDADWDQLAKIKGYYGSGGPQSRGRLANKRRMTAPAMDNLPVFDTPGSANADAGGALAGMLGKLDAMNANLARMTQGAAAGATITDARQDNRSFPVNVSSSIVQNITEAAAPAAAGAATAAAVGKAATEAASRIEKDPAF